MFERPHLFKFRGDDDTVIKGVNVSVVEAVVNTPPLCVASGSTNLSISESAARIAAKQVAFTVLGSQERLRVLAPESKASQCYC